jgi:iron complex outermembrane receptor protein
MASTAAVAAALSVQPASAEDTPAPSQPSLAVAQVATQPTAPGQQQPTVPAQSTSGGLEEIVVTAERRPESLQTTALSISAVGGEALRERHIVDLEDLSTQIPNVEFGRMAGDAFVFIRGVGYDSVVPGGETRVAIYSDGIYQPRTQSAFMGFYDVNQVEVLRGPQGTLYGRNATAGAVNILTNEPTPEVEGYVTGTVGNYDLIGTEGAVGGPLSNTLSARLAFQTIDHTGYGKNIGTGEPVNNEHTRNVRVKLKFEPSSNFSYRLVGDYGWEDDHSAGYRYLGAGNPDVVPLALQLGGSEPANPQDAAGFGPRFQLETYGVSGEGKLTLDPSTDLVSLTGYRHLVAETQSSTEASTLNLTRQFLADQSNSYSQELRLSHKFGDFADILVGAYYFHENNFAGNDVAFAAAALGEPSLALLEGFWTRGSVNTDAEAAFGEVRFHFLPQLTLTLGGRYSHDKQSINDGAELDLVDPYNPNLPFAPYGTQQASTTESRFDPKVTLDYKPTDALFFYVTYTTGFKSGGFDIGNLTPAFRPEVIKDYEAGLKVDLLDRRLRVNFDAFHYNYQNLQVAQVEGLSLVTQNAASAKDDGAEIEITALPVDNLRIGLNVAYLDARYTNFTSINPTFSALGPQDLDGNKLDYSPDWKINGEIGYTFHTDFGKFTPRADVTWVDTIFFSPFNSTSVSQPAWTDVDAFLAYESSNGLWSANAFVKNLTDHTYIVSASVSSGLVGFPILGQYGAPRTFGVAVTRRF